MSNAITKYSVRAFGIFTIASTVGQFFEFQHETTRYIIAAFTIIGLAGFAVSSVRLKHHNNAISGLNTLIEKIGNANNLEVKYIENIAELRQLWELDAECYGEANLSYERLSEWWKSYQSGIFILKESGLVVGAFGFFPIVEQVFSEIVEGRKKECEIGVKDFDYNPGISGHHFWYISGIVLKPRLRRTKSIHYILSHSLKLWLEVTKSAESISICALGFSKDGEALLRKFGFSRYKKASETLDHWPTYLLQTKNIDWIRTLVDRLTKIYPTPNKN